MFLFGGFVLFAHFTIFCYQFINSHLIDIGLHQGTCKPFLVGGHQVGLIRPDVLKYLERFPKVIYTKLKKVVLLSSKLLFSTTLINIVLMFIMLFKVFRVTGKYVELNPAFRDYKERSSRIAEVLQSLRKEGEICALKGWRDEVKIFVISLQIINYNFLK